MTTTDKLPRLNGVIRAFEQGKAAFVTFAQLETGAAAALRTVAAVLVVLNLIPTGFVFLEIRETLARIYSDQQIYRALVFTLVGGTLVPVVLLLAGDGAPWRLGAVSLIVFGGFAVRSLFLKIPHASHESRSRDKA